MAEPIKQTEAPKLKKTETSQDHFDNIDKQIVVRTEIDSYISEMMKGQPQTDEEIQVRSREFTFDSSRHRLSLPDRIKEKYSKKYSFRWVNKKKEWIDRAMNIRGWLIVNRVKFSDMPKSYFTALGTIENGDAILCYMPVEQAERLRTEPQRISRERVKDLPMEQWKNKGEDSPYYKPSLGQEERDGEVLSAGVQPDVQPQT